MKTKAEAVLTALAIEIRRSQGTRAWIDCPFHEESADRECFVRVSGQRANTFWCFACGEGGGLWRIVEHVRKLSEEDARAFVRKVGKGFRPPPAKPKFIDRAACLRRHFELPKGIRFLPLEKWVSGARTYALSRGLDQQAIDDYRIGYCTDGGHLQGRIVFPVIGARGQPVSYSARSFVGDEAKKYVTPDEREHPDKDGIFGQHLWRPVGEREILGVTEGAIDAFSVRRASGLDSGAMSGSDIRPRHIIAMSTFKVVVVLTDFDPSGEKAWRRVVASGLGRWTSLRRLRFARGEDANKIMMTNPARLIAEIARVAS